MYSAQPASRETQKHEGKKRGEGGEMLSPWNCSLSNDSTCEMFISRNHTHCPVAILEVLWSWAAMVSYRWCLLNILHDSKNTSGDVLYCLNKSHWQSLTIISDSSESQNSIVSKGYHTHISEPRCCTGCHAPSSPWTHTGVYLDSVSRTLSCCHKPSTTCWFIHCNKCTVSSCLSNVC